MPIPASPQLASHSPPRRPQWAIHWGVLLRDRVRLVHASYWCNHGTLAHHHLVALPQFAVVTRCELALLDLAVQVHVLALLESQGDLGKLSVKTEAVPVRVFPSF